MKYLLRILSARKLVPEAKDIRKIDSTLTLFALPVFLHQEAQLNSLCCGLCQRPVIFDGLG